MIPRSAECYPASVMEAKGLTPILNVSDIASTVAWFEKWGWKKLWDWGMPPTFGAVGSGKEACIFLCQGAQGGRGRGANATTFQEDGDEEDKVTDKNWELMFIRFVLVDQLLWLAYDHATVFYR